MFKTSLLVVSVLAVAIRAQVPAFGWCPEYVPMTNFDMTKFLGTWYEAERSFLISEVASRCAMANYTQGPDNKYRVSNEMTNRFTGIKRVLEGEIKTPPTKAEAGKLYVRYTTVPLDPETSYAVLDTDYTRYAVMWSCNNLGLVSAQTAWIMTRDRRPPGEVLQKAYGILDKYKISKTFFVKADQEDCDYGVVVAKPDEKPQATEAEASDAEVISEQQNLRSALAPDAPEEPEIISKEPAVKATEKEVIVDKEEKGQPEIASVPEVIKTASTETIEATAPIAPAVAQPNEQITDAKEEQSLPKKVT